MFKGILGFVLFIFFVFVFIAILIGGRVYSAFQKAKKAAISSATKETRVSNCDKYCMMMADGAKPKVMQSANESSSLPMGEET